MFGFTRRDECVGFLLLLEFFERESREQDESVNESETIYEALPAMWHYQAAQLAVPIEEQK